MDDVAESFWVPVKNIDSSLFGLDSIRKGVERFKQEFLSKKK